MSSDEIPIIPLGKDFLISFQGDVRDDQLANLKTTLFEALSRENIRSVVFDVSGVSVMDSYMARLLNELARGASMNGVEAVLVGIRPEVAMTLVEMGLSIPDVRAERDVAEALKQLERSD